MHCYNRRRLVNCLSWRSETCGPQRLLMSFFMFFGACGVKEDGPKSSDSRIASEPRESGYEVINPSSGLCLDSLGQIGNAQMLVCQSPAGNDQWEYDPVIGELRNLASYCLDSNGQSGVAGINLCHGLRGNQEWIFDASTGELRNPSSGLCLDSWGRPGDAMVTACHGLKGNQLFVFMRDGGLRYCAHEDEVCTFEGLATVYFGKNGALTDIRYTASVPCTTSIFSDPAPFSDPEPGASLDCWVKAPDRVGLNQTTVRPLSPIPVSGPALSMPVITAESVTDVPAAFVADPFLYDTGSNWYLFMEVSNKAIGRGQIGVARSSDGLNWTYDRIVLSEAFHLSYPYVFSYDGRYYMIPETNEANSIRLYESLNFPYDWHYVSTLVNGRKYVDSSIFYHESKWWIFTADTTNLGGFLFSSPTLFGPWIEHPKSPIVPSDKSRLRSGGRVITLADGSMFRFVQKDDVSYGEKVRAFQIDTLTDTDFSEHEALAQPLLSPGPNAWNASGMHNFDPWWTGSKWIASVDGLQGNVWSIGIYEVDPPGL